MDSTTTAPADTGQTTDDTEAADATTTTTSKTAQQAAPANDDDKRTEGKTFTQADLDRIISDRLGKAEQSWQQKQAVQNKKLAALLGGEDADEVDPAQALEDAQGAATKAVERADRAEVRALALAAGVKKERLAAFTRIVDAAGALKGVDRSDDDAVTAALDKAVQTELDNTPEFKGSTLPASSGGDRAGGAAKGVTLEQFREMDIAARSRLFQENQGLYKQLAAQAKAG